MLEHSIPMWPADLPPCFYVVLSPPRDRAPRGRVVLLHGLNSSHKIWLRTATMLRDELNLEVLLTDFYNHGLSPTLPHREMHCAETLCRQVRALIVKLGWQEKPMVLGGCSMGGGVALHYFATWPAHVVKMVLVGSAGLQEAAWVPTVPVGKVLTMLLGKAVDIDPNSGTPLLPRDGSSHLGPGRNDGGGGNFHCSSSLDDTPSSSFASFLLARLSFARTCPQYRVPHDIMERLRDAKVGVTVCTGGLDFIHTPQHNVWRRIPGVRILHYPGRGHIGVAGHVAELELWKQPDIWFVDSLPLSRL